MDNHLRDWRVSAGDEHTVFDATESILARVPCGRMSGRTFDEAADAARLIAAAPELLEDGESLLGIVLQAIQSGDWKIDGACDPDGAIDRLKSTIAKARGLSPIASVRG